MNPYIILAVVVGLVASHTGAYFKGRHDESMQQVEQQRDGLLAYAERIKQGEVQHDADQATINRLTTDLGRVRVHIPTCSAGAGQDGGAGVFSEATDRAFESLRVGDDQDFQRCDQLNIDAIRLNKNLEQ